MPVRVFSEDEKKEIREKLLSVGFPMLQEYGLVHMSIPKIAAAAGIGTGTFYRFFKSKEEYIYQLIVYRREMLLSKVITEDIRNGKRKLSKDEVRHVIELLIDRQNSVYANLSLTDKAKLFEYVDAFSPDIEKERQILEALFKYMDHPKETIDLPVLFNLIKILTISSQARNELHPQGYDRTMKLLVDLILNLIYD
ncbi:MAG: TetR/AcrR family transcriptional regulator [bacterium]|nr:TetR/AcrR family transcriptional regulator [bacterium]